MAQKFVTPITIKNLASSGSDALTVFLNGEAYGRVKLEAGGRISWSDGTGNYDTNIYRDSANVLATDDVLKATAGVITMAVAGVPTAALADGAIAVNTADNSFYFRASGAWNEISGNSTITVDDTAPADAEEGSLWFDSTSLEMFIYYDSNWIDLNPGEDVSELDDLLDVELSNVLEGQILKYNGDNWVNEDPPTTTIVSTTEPNNAIAGDLWLDSNSLELFVYYNDNWVEVNPDNGPEDLEDLGDTNIIDPTVGQVLKYDGAQWVNDDDDTGTTINSIDDITDVTITSATSGQFLKWNGTAWVNDAIDLATDTVGNYVSGLSAGTGISVTHTPGEGSTPTVGLNATLDDLSNVTAPSPSSGQFLKWDGSAWINATIPAINTLDDVGDVTITGVATGQTIQWNGTAWVNTVSIPVSITDTAPASPATGGLWFESDTGSMFVYYDSHWVEIGGGSVSGGGGGGGETDEGAVAMISSWMVGSN